jgi:hypothetical protein
MAGGGGGASGAYNTFRSSFDNNTEANVVALIDEDPTLAYELEERRAAPAVAKVAMIDTPEEGGSNA